MSNNLFWQYLVHNESDLYKLLCVSLSTNKVNSEFTVGKHILFVSLVIDVEIGWH